MQIAGLSDWLCQSVSQYTHIADHYQLLYIFLSAVLDKCSTEHPSVSSVTDMAGCVCSACKEHNKGIYYTEGWDHHAHWVSF